MKRAYFILSTGRCGTQWIANYLQQVYEPVFFAEHEPLDNEYQPRQMIRFQDATKTDWSLPSAVIHHVKKISRILKTRHYIECGHPCWSTIPYYIQKFQGRIGVIHLVRHPVHTAFSWMTHQAYCPPLVPHLQEKELLSPFDPGVNLPEYNQKWPRLSPYEKNLFYWMVINSFALKLEKRFDIPWFRLSFEDLFMMEGLKKLARFLGVNARQADFRERRVDNYRWSTEQWCDWRLILNHPAIMALSAQLGYQMKNIDEETLYRRYVLMG